MSAQTLVKVDSLSSGERKGKSLNSLDCDLLPCLQGEESEGSRAICLLGVERLLHSLPGIREVGHTNNNFPS
jgi:hypothetical protein